MGEKQDGARKGAKLAKKKEIKILFGRLQGFHVDAYFQFVVAAA